MTKDDIFASVGLIVIESQSVETLIDLILTYVLQDGSPLTYERLLDIKKTHRRKTLGSFFKQMKDRAEYSAGLDEVLDRFLESRNKLVHRFREVEGHNLESSDDIAKVHRFLNELHKDTSHLMVFFAAWIVAWQKQTGIGKGSLEQVMPPEGETILRDILFMSEFVEQHVFQKEALGKRRE
ncbi:MAG: hypothetical protein AAB393_05935 [Bacteroidota bacterium]